MLNDNLNIALQQLKTGKLRSMLTVLGITIGIATVIIIVAVLEGFFVSFSEDLNVLGANTFQVQKNDLFSGITQAGDKKKKYRKNIKPQLAKTIREECDLVEDVAAELWTGGQVIKYSDKKTNPNIQVAGSEPGFFVNNSYFVGEGRAFTNMDILNNRKVAVLGMDVVDKLFPFEEAVGQEVKINGNRFKVIGIIEEKASRMGNSTNNIVIIPLTVFEELYGTFRSANISISVKDAKKVEDAKEQVRGVVRRERKVEPGEKDDFAIFSNDKLIDTFEGIAVQIELAGAFLGLISLLVGSIGVMNIMLVTVTERTREIGIRKAVGARSTTILMQFLNESILLSLVGGALGMIIGFSIALFINLQLEIPFVMPAWIVITALIVTTIVGLGAGLYPASKAAKMDPIRALSWE